MLYYYFMGFHKYPLYDYIYIYIDYEIISAILF